jgi:hypothetical protein
MASLSAHLLEDYEHSRVIQQPDENEQRIIQSGAMEYNALAHGHGAPQTPGPKVRVNRHVLLIFIQNASF